MWIRTPSMIVGGPSQEIGRHEDRSRAFLGSHDEVRVAVGIDVEETEFEREILASASEQERQAGVRLVVDGELCEPELAELSQAQLEFCSRTEEVEVAV